MQVKTILITGSSSGIGFEAARALTKRGHHVIATCRSDEDIERLKSLGVDAVLMDLNHAESVTQGFDKIMSKTKGALDVLINNAGYSQLGALEDIPDDKLRAQFDTNVFGLMALTRLTIPVMRRQGHGRIINVSSILGFISLPFRGAYNASKYAVEGLSDTLRLELKSAGIDVILIEPGPIESKFRDTGIAHALRAIDMDNSHFKPQYQTMLTEFKQKKSDSIFVRSPDAVIKKFIHAIEARRPKAKYPVTMPTHLFAFLKRILPVKMLDRLLLVISKQELSPKPQRNDQA